MTGYAIGRGALRPMATNAEIHVQIFRPHGNRLLSHIPVALLAIHCRTNMRTMPESNVFRRVKPIHRFPGDVLSFGRVCGKFLDLRIVRGNLLMTCHAEAGVGNSRVRPLRYPRMATLALVTMLNVNPMIKRYGLRRSGLPLEVFSDGIHERFTTRLEDSRVICGHGGSRCFLS